MQIINTTPGSINLVLSKIEWLSSDENFVAFNKKQQAIKKREAIKIKIGKTELVKDLEDLEHLSEPVIKYDDMRNPGLSCIAW